MVDSYENLIRRGIYFCSTCKEVVAHNADIIKQTMNQQHHKPVKTKIIELQITNTLFTRLQSNIELKCDTGKWNLFWNCYFYYLILIWEVDDEITNYRIVWSKQNFDISDQRTLTITNVSLTNLGVYKCELFVADERPVLINVFNITLTGPLSSSALMQIVLSNNDTLIYDSRLRIDCVIQMYDRESYSLEWTRIGANMPKRSYVSGNSLIINR